MANWSEIQDDIGYEISKHVPLDVEEFVRIGCVSKLWRSFVLYHKTKHTPCAPWLLLATKQNDEKDGHGVRSIYSVSDGRVFNLNLLQAQGRRCWGTPHGWLITMGRDLNINLLNPFSQVQIPLPPQPTLPGQHDCYVPHKELCKCFIQKMVLTSNPSLCSTNTSHSPIVMAIYRGFFGLAFACPGDKAWVPLEGPASYDARDAIFFNGHFFSITHRGTLRICEIDTTPPTATDFASPLDGIRPVDAVYLVEMSGNLHLLVREYDGIDEDEDEYDYENEAQLEAEDVHDHGANDAGEDQGEAEDVDEDTDETDDAGHNQVEGVSENEDSSSGENEGEGEGEGEDEDEDGLVTRFHYQTEHFFVYKFDFSTKKWAKVDDLGDHAIIVGNSQSFSISTSNYPGLRSNCIYFTDDHMEVYQNGFCDMGIYDLGKHTIEDMYTSSDEISMMSRPVFFMPTLS